MSKFARNGGRAEKAAHDDNHINRLARFLDDSIPVPGLNYRVGIDGLLGLIPGIGDIVGALLSSYIIGYAVQKNLPASVILQMCLNVILESVVGSIPVFGDLFDFVWKANLKNTRLMQNYNQLPVETTVKSKLIVAGVSFAVFCLIVLISIAVIWLLRMFFQAI